MKEIATINAELRTEVNSRSSKKLREGGYLPGNVCGKGTDSISIAIKKDEFKKSLTAHGKHSVFKLDMGKKESYTVVINEIQSSPVSRDLLHINFQQVSYTEEIKASLTARFIGKELIELKGLLVNRNVDTIHVKGLPQNIPDVIDVDITNLGVGEHITVGDIKLPEGITIDMDKDQVVVSVAEAKVDIVETEEPTPVEA